MFLCHRGLSLSLRLYLSLVLGNVNVTLLSKQAKYVEVVAKGWVSPRVPSASTLTWVGWYGLSFWVKFSRLVCDLPPPQATCP